ncbi:TPA: NAD(P)-dependent oxidoreductase [Klebsiella aerogenes]|nr:NAD(P)-dependent oxidoreductase [Klebsiella oxytoca]HCD5425362.1 NAD(P)-dependent oxidoreductase [Klebsiella aerogenes]HCR0084090.1 NAD(P)-dependent oxidoreductase [Klebsiella aerogenes]HCR0222222.1 NAD(P)-dependent oxidoreductase [Klebsiella aerogenes]HCR0511977.1 NAD(P)-dependent oxidoreductase [Klebsiella aerogenes]
MEVLICRVERPLHVMWVGDLLASGLIRHATPQQAVASADVILSVLTDAEATLNVIQQIAVGCREGAIFCQMGTIGVGETREAIDLLESLAPSLIYLDAPVSGTKKPAENAQILVLASGNRQRSAAAECVFAAIARRTQWFGEAGSSQKMKLVLNAWLITMMEGVAESALLAEKLGFTPTEFWQALDGGPLAAPYVKGKLDMIAENRFPPQMQLNHALKDANLALDAAEGTELPILSKIADCWDEAAAVGYANQDLAAVYAWLAGKAKNSPQA